jgi:hypothetical protein
MKEKKKRTQRGTDDHRKEKRGGAEHKEVKI